MSSGTCDLTKKHCVPCEGGVPPLGDAEVEKFLADVPEWRREANKISRDFTFGNFVETLAFVNKVGEVAESEGHHPDLFIHQYRKLRITLWTHAVGGLTENDFILAAKIDSLL